MLISKLSGVLFGLKGEERESVGTRESVERLLQEGALLGALEPRAEELARNALELRGVPLERVMTPWERVIRVSTEAEASELRERVGESQYSRVPVTDADGVVVTQDRRRFLTWRSGNGILVRLWHPSSRLTTCEFPCSAPTFISSSLKS